MEVVRLETIKLNQFLQYSITGSSRIHNWLSIPVTTKFKHCRFHPDLQDSVWCPVCSCWPAHPSARDHTLSSGCDAAQRSSQRQQRASGAPHLSPCLRGKHETEKIWGAHAHSFPAAHESHNHHAHQNPLRPAATVQWGEAQEADAEKLLYISRLSVFSLH